MEKISWKDRANNEEVLTQVGEIKSIMDANKQCRWNIMGQIFDMIKNYNRRCN